MAAYPSARLLLPLLLLLLSFCCGVAALSFSYNFSVRGDLDSLKYTGDSSPSGDRVDLTTRGNHSSTGRVFYQQPVHLWDPRTNRTANFNTSFSFAISIGSDVSPSPTISTAQKVLGGGGMAFFIGPFPPNLGFFNGQSRDPNVVARSLSPPTVAVEFDTDHMGITTINTSRYQNWYTMGLVEGDGVSAGTMLASVVYDGSSKLMVVSLRVATGRTYSINRTVDFTDATLPVLDGVAIGFAAAAAANIESNQLLFWSFNSTDPTSSSSRKTQLWVIILVLAAVMLVGFVAVLLCVILRRRRCRQRPIHQIELQVARKFSYPKLAAATNNFSDDRKLGAGSFGEVYRGDLQDPSMPPVAVKRLTRMMQRTMTDYVTEVTTLGRISHRNLVRLVGWCDDDGGSDTKLLLVYELVAMGSLDRHLHGSDQRLLTWAERYKIMLDIGYAIEYLHAGCPSPILHRDIKPSNVMLDDNLVAKLGDFGLVRQAPGRGQGTLAGTAMIGSSDYIDPVCISNRTVSTASDMYSFGVLLLEMATGKDPAAMGESLSRQYDTLVEAVQESYRRGRVLEMADQRMNGDYEEWQIERVLVVGLLCVQVHRPDRPTIKESIAMLSYRAHAVPPVRLPMYSPITKTTE